MTRQRTGVLQSVPTGASLATRDSTQRPQFTTTRRSTGTAAGSATSTGAGAVSIGGGSPALSGITRRTRNGRAQTPGSTSAAAASTLNSSLVLLRLLAARSANSNSTGTPPLELPQLSQSSQHRQQQQQQQTLGGGAQPRLSPIPNQNSPVPLTKPMVRWSCARVVTVVSRTLFVGGVVLMTNRRCLQCRNQNRLQIFPGHCKRHRRQTSISNKRNNSSNNSGKNINSICN